MCTRCVSVGRLGVVCVLVGHTYAIDAGGKRWLFELPAYCGLVVVNARGDEAKAPAARHPFWRAVELWEEQGRRCRVTDGSCVWVPRPTPKVLHMGGRNYRPLERVEWSAEAERYVVTELAAPGDDPEGG